MRYKSRRHVWILSEIPYLFANVISTMVQFPTEYTKSANKVKTSVLYLAPSQVTNILVGKGSAVQTTNSAQTSAHREYKQKYIFPK